MVKLHNELYGYINKARQRKMAPLGQVRAWAASETDA